MTGHMDLSDKEYSRKYVTENSQMKYCMEAFEFPQEFRLYNRNDNDTQRI
jgi:hypothetical protein